MAEQQWVWVLTDETPHPASELDTEFGIGIALMGVFSTQARALAYLEAEGHTGLEWEEKPGSILVGPEGRAFAVTHTLVDEEWRWVQTHRPDLAAVAERAD